MAEKKVRGIPWMTKIDSWYQFSDGLYPGWHPGQSVIHNESKNVQNGMQGSINEGILHLLARR